MFRVLLDRLNLFIMPSGEFLQIGGSQPFDSVSGGVFYPRARLFRVHHLPSGLFLWPNEFDCLYQLFSRVLC